MAARRQPRAAPAGPLVCGGQAQVPVAGVTLTNPDRVLYDDPGITKRQLAAFYAEIADWILPHIVGRPLSLLRCPSGLGGTCFFQKHIATGAPKALRRVHASERSGPSTYLAIDDLAGLISLVQLGTLEIHPWGARAENIDRPDRLVLDLDPDEAVPWERVIEAARQIRGRLARGGLESFVKTTGGKGLHVVVPLRRRHGWAEVRNFAKAIARAAAQDSPHEFTTTMAKSARAGRIFLDYLRNDRGATAIAAYSTRARDGAPVATPLSWEELSPALRSDAFTLRNLAARLARLRTDPWADIGRVQQSITQKAQRAISN